MQEDQKFVLANTQTGVWKWDIVNDILVWDDSMYELYGIDAKDFSGAVDAWESSIHPDYKESASKELYDLINSDEVEFKTTFPIVLQSGEVRQIGARGHVERNPKGEPLRIYGVNWDKTREIETENSLEEQKKIAFHNAKLASIGELAAGVGHEINNPLAIIRGHLDLARLKLKKSGSLKNEEMESLFGKFDSSLLRISNIVKGLRTFSRNDSKDVSDFNFSEAIKESVNLVDEIYQKDGVNISIETPSGSVDSFLHGNRGKIQQVAMVLMSNAKDAAKNNPEPRIKVKEEQLSEYVRFSVADNGGGIPEDVQSKIFDPFFTTKELGEGTGIGLSLAHSIVQEHGGRIFYDTGDGGTIFYCEFPRTLDKNEELNSVDDSPPMEATGARIMVVDDEPEIVDFLSSLLIGKGYSVEVAGDGVEALNKLRLSSEPFSIVFSDLKMPSMSGAELCEALKGECSDKVDKFVLMTGGVDSNVITECGPDAFLHKPFGETELDAILAETKV